MKENSYNTKALVEASIITAFVVVLIIITSYVPIISALGTIILPIPIAMLYIRQDSKYTLGCIVSSFIITSLILNPITSLGAMITYGSIGITIGYCFKYNKSPYFTLVSLTLTCLIAYILNLFILIFLIENTTVTAFIRELINMTNEIMVEIKNSAMTMYKSMGMSQENLNLIEEYFKYVNGETILLTVPSVLLVYSFLGAYVNFYVTRLVLKKLKYKVINMISLKDFYVSNLAGAILIAITCIGIILNSKGIVFGKYLSQTFVHISKIILILNGIAALTYYLKYKLNFNRGMIVFIILFGVFLGMLNVLLMVGFIEMLLDFRKLDPYRIRKV